MIDRHDQVSVTRQAQLLGISRGSVYYLPWPVSEADLALMRRIDELHLEHPFMGARMLRDQLHRQGVKVGRRHIGTLMQRMGIAALAPQPGASTRAPGHKSYPYLLRKLAITRSNQVWALDTTYIPMARGFVYLTAVVDVASRRVLAHRVTITLEAIHAKEMIEQALAKYGAPEVVNTDQGSQGGFNGSLQHLNLGGVYGATRRVDAEVDGARSDAFAGCAVASARSGATVLGADCDRDDEREGGPSGRRVAGGRHSLVPSSWRHAIVYVETRVWKIFVVRGARRNWTAASPRRWCTGDRAPHWAKPFYGLTRADTQRCNSWRQARISGICRAVEGRAGCQKAEAGETGD